ncbi:hypothetical protein B7494_g8343 [Chlorociboria aeruginascens]|nr:hypothetical protein B7494_g8343 [Chlorociboria aeruginascens]
MAYPPPVPKSLSPAPAFTLSPIITISPSDEHGRVVISDSETIEPSRSSTLQQTHIDSDGLCTIEEETRSEQLQRITTLIKTWLNSSQTLEEDTILLDKIVLETLNEIKGGWNKTGSGLSRSKAHDQLYELAHRSPTTLRTPLPASFRYPTTISSTECLQKSSGKPNHSTSGSDNKGSSKTRTGPNISKTNVSSVSKDRSIRIMLSRRSSSNIWKTMKTVTGIRAIENLFILKPNQQHLQDELAISRQQVASVEPRPTPQALADFVQSIQGTEDPERTMKSRSFRRERVKTLREDPTRIRQLLASIERLLEDAEALVYVHLEEHRHAKAQELYEVVEKELGPFADNFYFPKYHLELMRQNDLLQGPDDFLVWNQALEMDD